ncbi:MAG: hypothetical protein AABW49_01955 [Nanoarchaeota archaeon]
MRSTKKGMSVVVVSLIVILISFVVLIGVINYFEDSSINFVKNTVCKISVRLRTAGLTTSLGTGTIDYKLRCKPIERSIRDETELYNVLGNELFTCWDKLLVGNANLIRSFSLTLRDTETACVICSKISPSYESITLNSAKLKDYLNEATFPGDKGFIYAITGTNSKLDYTENVDYSFTKEKPLYVAYAMVKSNNFFSLPNIKDITVGGGTVAATMKAAKKTLFKILKGMITKTTSVRGLAAISASYGGIILIPLGAASIAHKGNTYQALIWGDGAQIEETCDYLLSS